MPTYNIDQLTEALAAGARAFLAALDTHSQAGGVSLTSVTADQVVDFDPLRDALPFVADPNAERHSSANKLSALVYLGAIARLNAEEGRGANAAEISAFARRAGYQNGRVVNGWNSRPNSARAIEVIDGLRYVNASAHEWIRELAAELNVNLVGDITPIEIPER